MITKYKNNFPEVEAFLWDGDIEKAKEFFGDKWGNVAQVMKTEEGVVGLVMGLASEPFIDSFIQPGNYIVRINKEGACIKMREYDFTGQYTKI